MKTEFQIAGEKAVVDFERNEDRFTVKLFERELSGKILVWDPPFFSLQHCEHIVRGAFHRSAHFIDVHLPKGTFRIPLANKSRSAKGGHAAGGLTSPMPGKVIKVFVEEGAQVKKGDLLMMLEAMKMEHKISAPKEGIVKKIFFQEGQRVGQDVELLEIA